MMLLEHDSKELLADFGLPVPTGRRVRVGETISPTSAVVIKAQVPVGGRGKAGGIKLARNIDDAKAKLESVLGMVIKGHEVRAVRVEETVEFVAEVYLSFTVDAGNGNVRVLMSAHGGVEVEDEATRESLLGESVDLDRDAMGAAIGRLTSKLPEALRKPVLEAGNALIPAFLVYETVLLEINPLFIRGDGSWVIGDTKLSVDENAFMRQPRLRAIIEENPDLYVEAALKLDQDFDYVELDDEGDIGLVTTGAGLSMQLVDELAARGARPYNFCDIRTGQFRGDPGRLIKVLRWIAEGPSIRSVLINFFAGHTDLGEVAKLLVIALAKVPELKVPITARFIGNGLEEARATLAGAPTPIVIETDLERAIDLAIERSKAWEPAHG